MVLAVALIWLWRTTPVRRGARLLTVASAGFAVAAIGNFFEDVVGIEFAQWLFLVGLLGAALALVIAGVAALSVDDPLRWTGLLFIVYVAGGVAPDKWGDFISGASLLALGAWLLVTEPLLRVNTHH